MRRAGLILLVVLFAGQAAVGAEKWSERLGYAPDQRVVILYANYMGAAYEFNRPGQQLLEAGKVQSAGLMVPCPWFEEFAQWCRENPGHDIGVCLTLNSPGQAYRWRPLLGGEKSSSLVDADGYLWRSELQLAVQADREQVQQEIDQQITKFRTAGVQPTHLIPFMGSMLTRPDLFELYMATAQKYWIPAVMVELTPENIEQLRRDGFPLSDEMVDIVARYPLPKLDHLHFVPDAESYEDKRRLFLEQLKDLEPGLTQIIAGPADDTAGIRQMTTQWQKRVWENQLLMDDQIHQMLQQEGIVLTNWKEVMNRFETGAAPRSDGASQAQDASNEPVTTRRSPGNG